jgi:protein O-GlcNAc transferase
VSKSHQRNDPCPCGSGKKYKKCCIAKMPAQPPQAIPVVEHFAQVEDAYRRGQYSTAAALARQVLVRAPRHENASILLGAALAQTGDTEAAIQQMFRSIKIAPGNMTTYFNLGGLLKQRGDFDRARGVF